MKALLNKISIRAKIIGNTAIGLLLLVVAILYSLNAMNQIGLELEDIVNRDLVAMKSLTRINEHAMAQVIHFERALRYGGIIDKETQATNHFEAEVAKFDELNGKIHEEVTQAVKQFDSAKANASSAEGKAEYSHLSSTIQDVSHQHLAYAKHAHKVFELLAAGDIFEAEALVEKAGHESDRVGDEIETLLLEIEAFTQKAAHTALEDEHQAASTLTLIALIAILLSAAISWILSNRINQRLQRTEESLAVIASGDLTQTIEVSGNDEISSLTQSAQLMQQRLVEMIKEIGGTSQQLASASEEVSVISNQTKNNIQVQQGEISQVATAMTEMSATVNEVAQSIDNTASSAHEVNGETDKGKKQVEQATLSIQDLSRQIDDASNVVRGVEEASENINSVLDVIIGIAEQTNLLALNAAIEAARAGEQGRGFAVVADEVRTLAGRTQQSTEEINRMIDQLQTGSRNAVKAMQSSADQAQSVVDQSNQASESLVSISDAVGRINEMSTQIASAAEEQSAVSEEINHNLIKIDTMAAENSKGAEENASAGHSLAEMANQLQEMIKQFKVV